MLVKWRVLDAWTSFLKFISKYIFRVKKIMMNMNVLNFLKKLKWSDENVRNKENNDYNNVVGALPTHA